jgi:hypothetical protein
VTRTHAIVGSSVLASLLLFALGLLSPLTPSQGCPSTPALVAFVGLPVLLPIAALPLAPRKGPRMLLVATAVALTGTSAWLLSRIGCLP